MPGEFLTGAFQLSLEHFHAFRNAEMPHNQKWELIDGVVVMMPPPTLVHQRIARNLSNLLHNAIQRQNLQWMADHEIGILTKDDDTYNPEPDISVIDTDIALDQLYADRFYFVAEVLSDSDRPRVLDAKRDYYSRHEHCRGILFIEQDTVAAQLFSRSNEWQPQHLEKPDDRIVLDDLGDIGALIDLYRYTPLAGTA